jgi:hypothetical protein
MRTFKFNKIERRMIKMNLKEHLLKKAETISSSMEQMEPGTREHGAATEELVKIADRLIEIEKSEIDGKIRTTQVRDERIDKIVRSALTALSLVATTGLAIWGTKFTAWFERTDINTTTAGKHWFRSLFK